MIVKHLAALIPAVVLAAVPVLAAPNPPLTLRDAVAQALERNGTLRAGQHAVEAARQGVGIARSRQLPAISFEEAFTASNSPTRTFMMKLDEGRFTQGDFQIPSLNSPSARHDFRSSLTLQQPVYTPAITALREIAGSTAERKEHEWEALRQATAFQVFREYLDVGRHRARLAAADQAVADARENMRLAQVRLAAGLGLKSDELRSRAHLAGMEQQQITARNDLLLGRMQLALLIGMAPGDVPETAAGLPEEMRPASLDELTQAALAGRSDLKAARSERERAEGGVRLARSAVMPEVGAYASYQLNSRDLPLGADNDSWSAGVTLKWQLFEGLRHYRERDRAQAERSAAEEAFLQAVREARFQVQESLLRREEAAKRLEVARHGLADAEETVRLLSKRFENSLATMVELLDAQTALNQARANIADAEADYVLAGGRVYHSAGLFLKEILK